MDGPAATVFAGELSDEFHWDISQEL
jgi:hypothetical protein